jgi:transcription initiation factor TFIID TATA-box-binding protein
MPRVKSIINIENVVASATLRQHIDLNTVVKTFASVECRPEQFPGLIYRMDESHVVILVFASGKIVCTGAKTEEEVYESINKLRDQLEKGELIIP